MSAAINIIQSAALLALGTAQLALGGAQLIQLRRMRRIEQAALAQMVSINTVPARLSAAEAALAPVRIVVDQQIVGANLAPRLTRRDRVARAIASLMPGRPPKTGGSARA